MDREHYSRFPVDEDNILFVGIDIESCNYILQNRSYHKRLRAEAHAGITDDAFPAAGNGSLLSAEM